MITTIKVCSIDEEGRYGGPQRRVIDIARKLESLNIHTKIVYPKIDSERYYQEINYNNLDGIALDLTRLSWEKKILLRYVFRFFREIWDIYKYIISEKYHIIQINGTPQYKGIFAARLANIPCVWVLEDNHMPFIIRKITTLLAWAFVDSIIVTGDRVFDYYIKGTVLEKKRSYQIHAPVDTNIFDPLKVTPMIDSNIKHKNILTIAGISPVKGMEYFIEMASMLADEDKELTFYVSGTELNSQKKYSNKIKNLLIKSNLTDKNYKFTGLIDNIPAFLASGKIFVCTSISEAGPMTVWEAMSMGKAIVTTNVGAVNQYIKNGVSGFIVEVGDSRALYDKVKELLKSPEKIKLFGRNARKVAIKELDSLIAAKKYKKVYINMLNK